MTTLVETLFPGCVLGRGGSEANGLPIDVEPQNCVIVDKFHDNHYALNNRRDHYLVSVGESLVSLRICKAMPGSGYGHSPMFTACQMASWVKKLWLNNSRVGRILSPPLNPRRNN